MTEIIDEMDFSAEAKKRSRKRRSSLIIKYVKRAILPLIALVALAIYLNPTPEEKAQSHYKKGMALLEKGDLDKANIEFKNVLQIKKNMADAIYGMALVAEKKSDLKSVFQLSYQVAELDKKHVLSRIKLANIYMMAAKEDKAEQLLNQLEVLAPSDPEVLVLKASMLLRKNQSEQAIALARQALAKNPALAEAYVVLSAERFRAKDGEQALAFLNQGLQKSPGNLSLSMLKVSMLESMQQIDMAAQVLKDLIKLTPHKFSLRMSLVKFYMAHRRLDLAEIELRTLIDLDKKNTEAKMVLLDVLGRTKGKQVLLQQLASYAKDEPENMQFKFAQYGFLFQSGDVVKAKTKLQEIIKEASDKRDRLKAKGLLASIYLRENKKSEAETLIAEVLKEDAHNQQGLLLKAGLQMEAADYEAAILNLQIVVGDDSAMSQGFYFLAQAYEKLGEADLANQYYLKAIEVSGGNPTFRLGYAHYQFSRNQLEKSENTLADILKEQPKASPALTMLVDVKAARGDFKGAVAVIDKIRLDSPVIADFLLSKVYAKQKNYAASIPLLQRLYQAQPNDAQLLGSLVSAYVASGKTRQAEQLLNDLLAQHPEHLMLKLMLAQVYIQSKQPDSAIKVYQKIISQNAKVVQAYQELAKLYLQMGKQEQAIEIANQGLKQQPQDFTLQLMLADYYQTHQKFPQAKLVYENMLKTDPNSHLVLNNLAILLVDYPVGQDGVERAYQLTQKFAKLEIPQFRDTVGWVAYKAGKYAEAVKALEYAAQHMPNSPEVQYHLGKAYIAVLDKVNAKKVLNKALENAKNSREEIPKEEIKTLLSKL